MDRTIAIGPATTADAAAISSVLAANRGDPGLFQKPPDGVALSINDFFVARNKACEIVGCAGLHRDSRELAEIYAVAVLPGCQGQGVGRQLINACEQRAVDSGIHTVWLATIKPEYFSRYGFQRMSRWDLPSSVLLRKLRLIFQQPIGRWLTALMGRHTFMRRNLGIDRLK